ncbi:MAG: hypothetical protein EP344_18065 [Bacteroidetes bacterium]|nr:MAG: hypothetical protein EP344_18065 [Bacteroidota bacterium]
MMRSVPGTFLLCLLTFLSVEKGSAQPAFQWNILADLELSAGGEKSHFYYNEIDQDNRDLRVGVAQLNAIGKLILNPGWTVNARLLLERDKGKKLERFVVPQLNIQWLSKKRNLGITAGSFTNPFGAFNEQQLSIDRTFVGLPLAYSYYVNISDQIGFVENLGDVAEINIDGAKQWGTTNLYYGGYSTGAMCSFNIKPGKINWKIALVSGAPNLQKRFTDPLHFGLISRLKLQPVYFWEQGISFSHGSFLRASEKSGSIEDLRAFRQTLVGTDLKLGVGFLEFSGELIAAFYKTPAFLEADNLFDPETLGEPLKLFNYAAYADVKYEFSFLPGMYLAYRIDRLGFGENTRSNSGNWDNNVWRHSLAAGYRITPWLLTRVAVSTQMVENKPWDKTQRTFRLVLTAHY